MYVVTKLHTLINRLNYVIRWFDNNNRAHTKLVEMGHDCCNQIASIFCYKINKLDS